MDRLQFFLFVRAVLPGRPETRSWAGLARWVIRSHLKALAVTAFTVQNGRDGLEWLARNHNQIGQRLAA
jgi:hypothetical protein